MTRPQRIQAMQAAMAEIAREVARFHDTLRDTNDEHHQAFFAGILAQITAILANERAGYTEGLANTLTNVRSALRRLRLPDIHPQLEEPTPALEQLRTRRSNLSEAIENAIDATKALGMEPTCTEFDGLQIERAPWSNLLTRLDERLRTVQDSLADLQQAAAQADAAKPTINQTALIAIHVEPMKVELAAARFETKIGTPTVTDLAALTRAIEAMHDIAATLVQTTDGLKSLVSTSVQAVSHVVQQTTTRSWNGQRTLVSLARRRIATSTSSSQPPPEFNLDKVRQMIVAGLPPPLEWRPWITKLELVGNLEDLTPLSTLTELQTLWLDDTLVSDLTPLSRLTALETLWLDYTLVSDLTPLSTLTALQALWLDYTQVSDLTPLAPLTELQSLTLEGTQVSNLTPSPPSLHCNC